MPCTPFAFRGATGFICTRTRRPRCACGQPATLQCDAPTARRSGTCDRHICASCATEVGPELHLCPAHTSAGVLPAAQQALEF